MFHTLGERVGFRLVWDLKRLCSTQPSYPLGKSSWRVCYWGPIDQLTACLIGDSLVGRKSPPRDAPPVPWLVVVHDGGRRLRATASTVLESSFFWQSRSGIEAQLAIATRPAGAFLAESKPAVSRSFVRGVIDLHASPEWTPFVGVHRAPPGVTLEWDSPSSTPEVSEWCTPRVWPPPVLTGPELVGQMRSALDESITKQMAATDALVSTQSAGLDSTFVVASLVRLAPGDTQVHGLVHSPHPSAGIERYGDGRADEYPLARTLEDTYGGRLVVERIQSNDDDNPLDAALAMSTRSTFPLMAPGNASWILRASDRANELGASVLFHGGHGNYSFSNHHGYARDYHLSQGQLKAAWRARGRTRHRLIATAAFARAALSPQKGFILHRKSALWATTRTLGETSPKLVNSSSDESAQSRRQAFTQELAGHGSPWLGFSNPDRATALSVDPFKAQQVIELAAAISPSDWHRAPPDWRGFRGFARLVAEGRVPDSIRLAPWQSSQGRDAWYLLRREKDRFLGGLLSAQNSEIGTVKDLTTMQQAVESWPWGEAAGPDALEFLQVLRVVHLQEFIEAHHQTQDWVGSEKLQVLWEG